MNRRSGCQLDVIAALLRLDETGCDQALISVGLAYDRDDPCAVRISFSASPVVWLIGRDLLIEGIEGTRGDGDVHLLTISGENGDVTILTLGCGWPDEMSFAFTTADLIMFVALTDDVVPIGAEAALVQNDLRDAVHAWTCNGPDEEVRA